MVLSYDADERQVWTIEGNFNDRVERSERNIESAWKLGHLTDGQVKH